MSNFVGQRASSLGAVVERNDAPRRFTVQGESPLRRHHSSADLATYNHTGRKIP